MVRITRSLSWVAAASAALGTVPQLHAQTAMMQPAMLSVTCEWIKPGMGPAHDKHEEAWARASEAVKGFAPGFALQSMTGPAETCWLTRVSSYEHLGKNNVLYNADPGYAAALPSLLGEDSKYVSDVRSFIAVLRTDLSEGEMPTLQSRRFTNWSEWRVRPGNGPAFEAGVKAYVAASKRAGVKPEFRLFQVMHGAPSDTYWLFSSQSSMAGFDVEMANDPKIAAVFTPEDGKIFDNFFAKAIVSMNSNLWSYNSAQSSLTAEQRASDPYWKLKAKAAPKKP